MQWIYDEECYDKRLHAGRVMKIPKEIIQETIKM